LKNRVYINYIYIVYQYFNTMLKEYFTKNLPVLPGLFLLFIIASCTKDTMNSNSTSTNNNTVTIIPTATPVKLGLIEVDTAIYKLLFMDVSKIGTQTVNYDMIFDTGSGGMVIDANGIIPASMITSTGFNFTGDSTIVNGITITSQTSLIEYGDDASTLTKVYGNLAYAPVTIGEPDGNVVIKRLPFFLYYKGVDAKGKVQEAHYFDVLGVSPEYDVTFPNNAYITSPLSYYDPGTGLTRGFKMAALGTSNFSVGGTYVPGAITLGLTSGDLSSAGFVMQQLYFTAADGYLTASPGTVTYNGKLVSTPVIFDTGTEPYSYIEDKTAASGSSVLLANNSSVSIATTSGFNFAYTTTAADYLTYVENPGSSTNNISIFGMEFFLKNSYLLDYTDHKLGVKNN